MIEDLIPFFLMIGSMVVMVIIWGVHTVRGSIETRAYYRPERDARNDESSAGVGSTFQG